MIADVFGMVVVEQWLHCSTDNRMTWVRFPNPTMQIFVFAFDRHLPLPNHRNNVTLIISLQAALQELEELKQIVPKESLVYFLIGKVSWISKQEVCLFVTVCSYV